jgi:UDP-3-O-acyl-N-acetylglucosamine deacetylase
MIQDQRIGIILKAAANGFSITEDAIDALQTCTSEDPVSVLDRILCGLVSAEKKPPIITVEHVRVAIWSYTMDEMICRNILAATHPRNEGTYDERKSN